MFASRLFVKGKLALRLQGGRQSLSSRKGGGVKNIPLAGFFVGSRSIIGFGLFGLLGLVGAGFVDVVPSESGSRSPLSLGLLAPELDLLASNALPSRLLNLSASDLPAIAPADPVGAGPGPDLSDVYLLLSSLRRATGVSEPIDEGSRAGGGFAGPRPRPAIAPVAIAGDRPVNVGPAAIAPAGAGLGGGRPGPADVRPAAVAPARKDLSVSAC
ncbi:hypothetical protein K438DRAFT_1756360 [Mycena galopus ATCC 62051]|nr:hypothetical protein K438DRAFT_1756360 [Mycena galopus ATCC 62051]